MARTGDCRTLWADTRLASAGFATRKGFSASRGNLDSMTTSCDQTSPSTPSEITSITTRRTGSSIPITLPPSPSLLDNVPVETGLAPSRLARKKFQFEGDPSRSVAARDAAIRVSTGNNGYRPLNLPPSGGTVHMLSRFPALLIPHPQFVPIAVVCVQLKAVWGCGPLYVVFYYLTRPRIRR